MNCATVQNYCEPYQNGLLHSKIVSGIESHLLQCAACRHEYEIQKEMRSLLHTMPEVSRSDKFWAEMNDSVRKRLSESKKPAVFPEDRFFDRFPVFHIKYQFAAAVLVLTLIFAGMMWSELWHTGENMSMHRGGNGEEMEFYLEEHNLAQGCTVLSQSAFASVAFHENNDSKRNGDK